MDEAKPDEERLSRMIRGVQNLKDAVREADINLPPLPKLGDFGGFIWVEPDNKEDNDASP